MDDKLDFSEFDDWLVKGGPGGDWPSPYPENGLPEKLRPIVIRNANLLLDKEKWAAKVSRFENELDKIDDEKVRAAQRKDFHIRFDYCRFESNNDGLDFTGFHFPCTVDFQHATFGKRDVSFIGATFGDGGVSFYSATFGDGIVWFNEATFGKGNVSFDSATFGDGDVLFTDVTFGKGKVSFAGATFGTGYVWFDGTTFGKGYVSFSETTFGEGIVLFGGATFGEGNVSFNSATFGEGDVLFTDATFGEGNVSFIGATFAEGDVSFDDATFGKGNVWFAPKHLEATSVHFKDTDVVGNMFVRAEFPKSANFQHLNVKGTVRYSGCEFAEIPDFRDAKFDRPPDVARMEVPAPDLEGRRFLFRICGDKEAVSKYRKLKAMALAAHDHEMDGKFFAYEMMAKRGMETKGFFPLLFNSLYGVLGGYGQSFMRPIGWLIASWLSFFVPYFVLSSSALVTPAGIWFALRYSLRHTIPLLNSFYSFAEIPSVENYKSTFQKNFDAIYTASGSISWFTNLAVIQQFIGLVLLFLLLLALRNTFRLK